MSALVFQIATIAALDRALLDGEYKVPVRVVDQGDCLTTVPDLLKRFSSDTVEVTVRSAEYTLPVAEAGRAAATALRELALARNRDADHRDPLRLTVLRYRTAKAYPKDAFWVLQRELRREGLDICPDGPSFLIGSAERVGLADGEKLSVFLVGRFDNLSDRDGLLINRTSLRQKTVLIVGLGSVGSVVACDLARSGVGRFILGDRERLEWGNVVRHAAGVSEVGRLKTRIVADLVRDRNPFAQVSELQSELASSSREVYAQAVESADLVVCATDNRSSRLICNRLCVKYRKTAIFGGLTRGAYAGTVFRFRTPSSMCYHCFVSAFPEAASDREGDESEYAGGPDGHLSLDIAPITNLMAKLSILELQAQAGVVDANVAEYLSKPWYIWINRLEGEYEGLAASMGTGGPQILQWIPVEMVKIEECPHCGGGAPS